ncbi:MAG: SCP2 sterol-binding domain-containing protein [Alphaproteobacteria bacterium]|nr:SCP2 sterol-binding domain-containing protein [Alphaproteobacteria bacterium]
MSLQEHPTVQKLAKKRELAAPGTPRLTLEALKQLALDCGADDAGAIRISRPEVAAQRADILKVFPGTRVLLSILCRMNREAVRTPVRSIANAEFHETYDTVNAVARDIVKALAEKGVRALNAVAAFPMEAQDFPGKTWPVGHKPMAEAAGLGRMGIHRSVIHPRFGSFVLLDTVLIDAEIDAESGPIEYNPCLSCKLCVAACPVGALSPLGEFNFAACYTHNYREFLGGFKSWVEELADSKSAADYRNRVSDGETVSMWQSLSFKPGYKAAYCLAVCPAGEDVIGPYLDDRVAYRREVLTPLQEKAETVYVLKGSDAEAYAARFPNKVVKRVRRTIEPQSLRAFLMGLRLGFQWRNAKDVTQVFHFRFKGRENLDATVAIDKGKLHIAEGLEGKAGLEISVDGDAWLRFIGRRQGLFQTMLKGRLRLKGDRNLMKTFRRCFAG